MRLVHSHLAVEFGMTFLKSRTASEGMFSGTFFFLFRVERILRVQVPIRYSEMMPTDQFAK